MGGLLAVGVAVMKADTAGSVVIVNTPAAAPSGLSPEQEEADAGLRMLGSGFTLKHVHTLLVKKIGAPAWTDAIADYRSPQGDVEITWRLPGSASPTGSATGSADVSYVETDDAAGGVHGTATQGAKYVIVTERADAKKLPVSVSSLHELVVKLLQETPAAS